MRTMKTTIGFTMKDFVATRQVFGFAPCTQPEPAVCTQAPATPNTFPIKKVGCAKKKDSKMSRFYDDEMDCYVESVQSDTEKSRQYLRGRVNEIYTNKYSTLQRQFGFRSDDAPRNFTDLLARLTAGKYVIPEDKKGRDTYDPLNWVEWRDPAIVRDDAGVKVAETALDKARTTAMDAIMIADPKDGLAAVQTFEAWTYTKA